MSVHVKIEPILRQPTQMSCWWTCMRMVFAYYGRSVPELPEDFAEDFRRRWYEPTPALPRAYPRVDGSGRSGVEYDPADWYALGVPMNTEGLEQLCELTGFQGVNGRPAFGRWTLDDVEEHLRACGPYIFVGNWNGNGFHAVLMTGRVSVDGVEATTYIDPAMGMELEVSIAALNASMAQVGMNPFNPIHLPTDRPIRETH